MDLILIYETDKHHSYSSRDIIGVATDQDEAFFIVKSHVKKFGANLSKDDIFNLQNYNQTQGHKGGGEYDFEEVEANTLL